MPPCFRSNAVRRNACFAALAVVLAGEPMGASATETDGGDATSFDVVTRRDGRRLRGYIVSESARQLLFHQVVQPPGRPMFGVTVPLDRAEVAAIERTSPRRRMELKKRLNEVRRRAAIEAGKMESLRLSRRELQGRVRWRFSGKWFQLDSTAPEDLTRRAIVRLEQVFTAYSRLMPPRLNVADRPLRISLFGVREELRQFCRQRDIAADRGGLYLVDENLVAAGGDLTVLASQLSRAAAEHDRLRRAIKEKQSGLPRELADQRRRLLESGRSKSETARIVSQLRRKHRQEVESLQAGLAQSRRRNEALFHDRTRELMATLYHEAFHAYLENYVYPHRHGPPPRWLNEGLAQVFEAAVWEAGTLRVDAPHPAALAVIKADLDANRGPLPLQQILTAGQRQFLSAHDGPRAAGRYYAYSWALADYLMFERRLLGAEAMHEFVTAQQPTTTLARFEKLTGEPATRFQQQWRNYLRMLTSK